jgi:tyrosinase
MTHGTLRVRRSILEIQREFDDGKDTRTLEDLMTAWAGIKALDPAHPNSFHVLGGYHGEPFRGAGYSNNAWWGGWCNHGNVLFPTWHRIYLQKLEKALQSIAGCENVMMPYWDETDDYSLKHGIPSCLTDEFFTYSNGKKISNPLISFTFPVPVADNISADHDLYTKPLHYKTVRYPYSGLVGNEASKCEAEKHNAQWPTHEAGNAELNKNVKNWLNQEFVTLAPDHVNPKHKIAAAIRHDFEHCLDAPNYTVFSNTTSRQHYNELQSGRLPLAVALEDPHNHIHLAVGGCDITSVPGQHFDASPIVGANGDMGENDTAGLDPIFYFHHCNVDRMFWIWQKKNGHHDALEILDQYPGTNSVDSQGPTPGIAGNVWLGMDTPLMPFVKENGQVYTSKDVVNIEKQLNYSYSIGSLDREDWSSQRSDIVSAATVAERAAGKVMHVSAVNKGAISGSFVIAGYAHVNGEKHLVGIQSVLSRHAIQGCANCQTHLLVKAHFSLAHIHHSVSSDSLVTFSAEVIGHKNEPAGGKAENASTVAPVRKQLAVTIR